MSDRALFRRSFDGFQPFNETASELAGRVKLGEIVELKATKVRNGKYHRLFFAILKLISDNSNPHVSEKAALYFAKLAAGVGDVVPDSKGRGHFVPGSISFAQMDQDGFVEFVHSCIPALVGRFMVGTAPKDVIAEAMSLCGETQGQY